MKKHIDRNSSLTPALTVAVATALLIGCVNYGENASSTVPRQPLPATGETQPTVVFTIKSPVDTLADSGTGSTLPTFDVRLLAQDSSRQLTEFCQKQGASSSNVALACKCRYEWKERNASTGLAISRMVETEPSRIASFNAHCPAPDVYETEIPETATIDLSIQPAPGSRGGFKTNVVTITKQMTSPPDFYDREGRAFRNVYHYVCRDIFQRYIGMDHKHSDVPSRSGDTVVRPVANYFEPTATGYSAQTYYYDFYVRSGEEGNININPANLICPKVMMPDLNGGAKKESFYPMDSTFSVALQRHGSFEVPILANTYAAVQGQQTGYVLGYAAKPNADGTCSSITTTDGLTVPTYRLRLYKVVYPIRYNGDGKVLEQQQASNRVLVLDRPVHGSGDQTGTRLGPKPCPQAFYVGDAIPYRCSADVTYFAGKRNIDGTKIPKRTECPIYPPIDPELLDSNNNLPIRPIRAYLPHYIEDESFKACAPQSDEPVDPEILYRYDKNFGSATDPKGFYCAVHYPSNTVTSIPGVEKSPRTCTLNDFKNAVETFKSATYGEVSKTYGCSRTSGGTTGTTPSPGCCQSGPGNFTAGADSRNAAMTGIGAVSDLAGGGWISLPRGKPNVSAGSCFDPYEN